MNNIVVFNAIIASILKLALARYIYVKNKQSKVNKLFASLFVFQALWDIGKGFMWLTNDPTTALFFSKLSYMGYIISVFVFPNFVWRYLKKDNSMVRNIHLWYLPMYLLIFVLWATDLVIKNVYVLNLSKYNLSIFSAQYGLAYTYFFLWFQAVIFFYMFFLLLHKYVSSIQKEYKDRLKYFIIGLSFPILIGIPTGVILPFYGKTLFPHNTILTSLMCLFIGYGMQKYKFLSVTPYHEDGKLKLNKKSLKNCNLSYGSQYLVCSSNSHDKSYSILLDKLNKKKYGLIITSRQPNEVRKEYGIKTTPIIWITDTETDELSVGFNDVEQLYQTIVEFTNKIPQSYVLIDGLNVMMKKNSFSKMLFFIKNLKSVLEKTKSVLIVPAEKYELSKKQENMLVYEFRFLPSSLSRSGRLTELIRKQKNPKFIALGYDSSIESLIKEIEYQKKKLTVISPSVTRLKEKNVEFVSDNPLRKKSLEKYIKDSSSYIVFVSLINDSDTMLAINLLRTISEKIQIIANVHRTMYVDIAERAGADAVIASSTLGGHLLAMSVNYPNTIRWIMEAVTRFGKGIILTEVVVGKKYHNKTVAAVDKILGQGKNVIAVKTNDYLKQIPEEDFVLKKGDILLIVKKE